MKQSIAHALIRELRSGRWQALHGRLGHPTIDSDLGHPPRRCCLGVLQEMYKHQVDPKLEWAWDQTMPDDKVSNWAGLDPDPKFELPDLTPENEGDCLAILNDRDKSRDYRDVINWLVSQYGEPEQSQEQPQS